MSYQMFILIILAVIAIYTALIIYHEITYLAEITQVSKKIADAFVAGKTLLVLNKENQTMTEISLANGYILSTHKNGRFFVHNEQEKYELYSYIIN